MAFLIVKVTFLLQEGLTVLVAHHAGTDQGFRSLLYLKRPSGACDTGAVRSNGLFERVLGVIETI